MIQKNYLNEIVNQNEKLQKILKKYLFISQKKFGEKNLVTLLYHELSFYYSSTIYNKEIRKFKKSKFLKDPKFGFRNEISIFEEKISKTRFLFNMISKVFSFKKKIFYGLYVPISKIEKINFFFRSLIRGYQIDMSNEFFFNKKILFQQEYIIKNLVNEIHTKFKLKNKEKTLKEIKVFLSLVLKKSLPKQIKYDLVITGTPARIQNRLNLFEGLNKKNNIVFMHSGESGFIKSFPYQFDERLLGNKIIGFGKMGCHLRNDLSTLKPLSKNFTYYPSKSSNLKSFDYSKNIKKFVPIEDINQKKGLYISSRIKVTSITNPYDGIILPDDYINWQKYLLKNLKKLTYKVHPKQLLNFNLANINIEYGKLFNIYRNYDYIIFDYLNSLAFNEIVQSNMPILYFDIGLARFSKIGEKILNERCYVNKINIFKNYEGFNKIFTIPYKKKNNKFSNMFCGSNEKLTQSRVMISLL